MYTHTYRERERERERENMEDGQVNRRLLLEEKIEDPDGGSSGERAAEGGISSSSVTAVVVFSTSIAVVGSFGYGFAAGFSSQAESGIRSDLGLSTAAYSLFGSMLTIGGMVGATVSGKVADLIGRRFAMLLSGVWFILGWLAILFAQGAWMLDVGRAVLGFGIAIQAFVGPAYIGEISPKNTRGGFTAANQVIIESMLFSDRRSFMSLRKIESYVYEEKNYVPDSQLMRNYMQVKIGKEKDLEATLRRLRGKDADVSQEAAEIRDYIEIVQQLPKAKFLDMFQRKYAHSLTIPFSVLGLLLMDKTGRRPLWMFSAAGTCLANFLIGLGFLLQNLNQNKDLTAILVFSGIQLYVATFSAGMASTPWVVVSELLPLDIKGSAGSLITFCNWASAWVVSYGYIFILDWNPAGTFFILAGICASTVVFVAKLVPETKGRTLEEIQASLTLFT
ncbi:hypothetical protein RHGRI_014601 [Rhododendron griersonianum]|uniref:Major facilitator superfamily (MFS) profile domain-containing protein n=1 Tax=Rhododendron griersonianum TaxID=479676 RepID=A0AAV6KAF2_9ERIC|nr:hypothetical protein RHGRI_014601 [Rhododendron griersonianum]